ncbi:hypothetical protein GQ44DRAFT_602503, partial [Phaeosphaeriaceae sp. PMI808]
IEKLDEVIEGKATIEGFELDTFKLFIEFIYRGYFAYHEDLLNDDSHIHQGFKAWVLGNHLGAIEFKDFAMRTLYNSYFPHNGPPLSVIHPDTVNYCCNIVSANSKLYEFLKAVMIVYWDEDDVIVCNLTNKPQWEKIWTNIPDLRNNILWFTNQACKDRKAYVEKVKFYLEYVTSIEPPISNITNFSI